MNVFRAILAILLCFALFAQEELPERTFTATVNVVVVPVTITDKQGNYVAGLKPEDFRLYDNNKLQDIRVEEAVQPISLVVAVQANPDMEGILPMVKQIGPVISQLIIGQNGEAAILAYDGKIRTMQDFTADSDQISSALQKINPGSSMNRVKDAAREAVRMLRDRPPGNRRVLLIIGETRDKSSEGNLREIMAEVQLHNVSVYTANVNRLVSTLTGRPETPRPSPFPATAYKIPGGGPQTPGTVASLGHGGTLGNWVPVFVEIFRDVKSIFVSNPAEVFTKYSGGKEFSFMKQQDLERALSEIGSELHSQYMISYMPDNKSEGGFHELRVNVSRPQAADWDIRYRPGYWMAAVPQ